MVKKNEECFFDPTQPLTSTIFKSLNLEFMCCILSGLKQISDANNQFSIITNQRVKIKIPGITNETNKITFEPE